MKARQYREMSTDELENTLEELQRRLFDLRAQAATEKLENCRSEASLSRPGVSFDFFGILILAVGD